MDAIIFLQSKQRTDEMNFSSVADQLIAKTATAHLLQSLVKNNESTRSRIEPTYFKLKEEEAQRKKKPRSVWQYLWG
jgi:ABC-type uncharacterized transport system substrate-binding protein